MGSVIRVLCLLGFVSVAVLAPSVARAQGGAESESDTRARELFENGARLYDEGLYEDAVTAWQAAYKLSPRPLLLFNMANAYERLGRYQEALDHLNRYRAMAPSDERETLERRIRNIERRLEELRAQAASAPTVDPLLDATGSRMTVSTTAGKSGAAGPHPAGIALIGGGAAGLVVGGVFGGLAIRERGLARPHCTDPADSTLLCTSEASPHITADRRWSIISDIGFIAGGAALGAGVIVLIVDATGGGGSSTAVRLTPGFGPGGVALTLDGRF